MRLRYSVRALLIAVALSAPVSLYLVEYLRTRHDYVLPTPTEYTALIRELTTRMSRDGVAVVKSRASVHAQSLAKRCPPLGIAYWESQAMNVKPGMHKLALYRHLPNQSIGTSFLVPQNDTQVMVYAVDSQLAAICEVTIESGAGVNSLVRVVKFHGFAEHNLAFDEWGSLDAEQLRFDDDNHALVVFGEDGV